VTMKTPTVLLLTSVLALAPATAMAQHVDVNPGGIQVQGGGHGPAVVEERRDSGHHERREGLHEERREGHDGGGHHEERH
jgi:hypothetical protein